MNEPSSRPAGSMEHPVPEFHDELRCRNAKSPVSSRRPGLPCYLRLRLSAPRARADHEAVKGIFGNLPPQILVGAIRLHRVDRLLKVRILAGEFSPQFV